MKNMEESGLMIFQQAYQKYSMNANLEFFRWLQLSKYAAGWLTCFWSTQKISTETRIQLQHKAYTCQLE